MIDVLVAAAIAVAPRQLAPAVPTTVTIDRGRSGVCALVWPAGTGQLAMILSGSAPGTFTVTPPALV
jgi:hypothetical protein